MFTSTAVPENWPPTGLLLAHPSKIAFALAVQSFERRTDCDYQLTGHSEEAEDSMIVLILGQDLPKISPP